MPPIQMAISDAANILSPAMTVAQQAATTTHESAPSG